MAQSIEQKAEIIDVDGPESLIPDPRDLDVYRSLEQTLRAHRERLIRLDGQIVEIPDTLYLAMVRVAHLLAMDKVVFVTPMNKELTTQEAAGYLGVSRPTVVKLLDAGAIPYTRPGKHRRIKFEDLEAYRERQYAERKRVLNELTQEAEAMGGYEVSAETLKKFRIA